MPTATLERSSRTIIRPEQRPFQPYGAAECLLYYQGAEVVLSGPAGTGKSRACLEKLYICASKYAGMRGLICRKTRTSLTQTAMVTWETKVLPVTTPVAFNTSDQAYTFPNGSVIVVGGLDKASKIMSTEYDMIYVQEATELTESDWESLTTRLRNGVMPYQQLLADCNPDAPTHWLRRRSDRGAVQMFESRHEDNPTVTPDYLAKLDALTGVRKLRLRLGIWAAAEGMVYESWDRAVHIVDADKLREWGIFDEAGNLNRDTVKAVYASVDWGFTNPGVIQVYAIDGDGRAYMVHEVYLTGQLINWWVSKALALKERYGITRWFCDPAEPAYIRQFIEAGLNAERAQNDIPPGIQAVQKRLAIQPDGRARLYVYSAALEERDPSLDDAKKPCGLVEERDGYVWQIAKDGKPNKEEPVDADNHAEDTQRYMIYTLDINAIQPKRYTLRGRR